jgi:hypothetical protein
MDVSRRLMTTGYCDRKSFEPLVNFLRMARFDAFTAVGSAQVLQDRFIG